MCVCGCDLCACTCMYGSQEGQLLRFHSAQLYLCGETRTYSMDFHCAELYLHGEMRTYSVDFSLQSSTSVAK